MPPATVADDAMLANVRQTGMSLWVLIALQSAIRMADAMGRSADMADFTSEYHATLAPAAAVRRWQTTA